jgi:hypothetical protein
VRAFGDNLTLWGTPVVLIETGPFPSIEPDPSLVRLNFVGILSALDALATGNVDKADPKRYETLPMNESKVFYVLVKGATVSPAPASAPSRADIGISANRRVRTVEGRRQIQMQASIADLGDLRTYGALRTIDGSGSWPRRSGTRAEGRAGSRSARLVEAAVRARHRAGQPAEIVLMRPRGSRRVRRRATSFKPSSSTEGASCAAVASVLLMAPLALFAQGLSAAGRGSASADAAVTVLRPARVFDGERCTKGGRSACAAIASSRRPGGRRERRGRHDRRHAGDDADAGMVEGHSHVLLHPYNETTWNDQVLHESQGLRVARAHEPPARDADGRLHDDPRSRHRRGRLRGRRAEAGGRPGDHPRPRMLVTTRAIVATGSYGPKGFALDWHVPQGAEEADGDSLIRVVRDQIGTAPTGSRSTRTTAGARAARRRRRSRWRRSRRSSRPRAAAAGRSVAHSSTPKGCADRSWRRRDDRARRRPRLRSAEADEGAQRRALPDARPRRRDVASTRDGRRARGRSRGDHPQARELQGRARRRASPS